MQEDVGLSNRLTRLELFASMVRRAAHTILQSPNRAQSPLSKCQVQEPIKEESPIRTEGMDIFEPRSPCALMKEHEKCESVKEVVEEVVKVTEPAIIGVWHLLRTWINQPATTRQQWLMKIPGKNNRVRTLLFEREKKARFKYSRGLALFDTMDGLVTAQQKMADACYFLCKEVHERKEKPKTLSRTEKEKLDDDIKLINDLSTVLLSLLDDLKK